MTACIKTIYSVNGSIINSRLLYWLCLEVGKQRITELERDKCVNRI